VEKEMKYIFLVESADHEVRGCVVFSARGQQRAMGLDRDSRYFSNRPVNR